MLLETGELIKGINNKDEKAWKVLFHSFYVPLCHHSLRILKDDDAVADVVQETFVRLWNGDTVFENGKALTAYLYRAVFNNSLKYLRDRNAADEHLKIWQTEEGEVNGEYFAEVVDEEVFRKLCDLINLLPADRREIMLMSLEGMSGEEIAGRLGITIHTVKQQKYRAYKFLRERLGKHWPVVLIFFLS